MTDYRAFIKRHRLVNFDPLQFKALLRDALHRYIKAFVAKAPAEHGIPAIQIGTRLDEVNELKSRSGSKKRSRRTSA